MKDVVDKRPRWWYNLLMDETKQRVDELSERFTTEGIDHETVQYRDGWIVAVQLGELSEYRLQPTHDGRWNRYAVSGFIGRHLTVLQDTLSEDVLVADLLRELEIH